jgi:hypothetical protein
VQPLRVVSVATDGARGEEGEQHHRVGCARAVLAPKFEKDSRDVSRAVTKSARAVLVRSFMSCNSAPAKSTPSLLDRQRAESAQPLCTTQRALLTLFLTAAALLFTASTLSAPSPAHRIRSADLARSIIRRHAREAEASAGGGAVSPSSSFTLPRTAAADLLSLRPLTSSALAVDDASAQPAAFPPPPPPAARAPAPASVADPTCHARLHTDYMGERAPVWGLGKPGFHLADAAECCAACQAHAAVCGKPDSKNKAWWPARPELRCQNNPGCNLWVFCPEAQCFAFDIHVHTKVESVLTSSTY